MAIDEMVGSLRATLKSLGVADRTLVVFSSDNGFHMGEYSLKYSKMTPFDIDNRVPLVVVGPGVPAGAVATEIAANTDLAPTFAALAGGPGPLKPDGVSLLSLIAGQPTGAWRQNVMIAHRRTEHNPKDPDATKPQKYDPISYEALRTEGHLYVEYVSGEVSLYDLKADPYALVNIAGGTDPARLKRFHEALEGVRSCRGAEECWQAESIAP